MATGKWVWLTGCLGGVVGVVVDYCIIIIIGLVTPGGEGGGEENGLNICRDRMVNDIPLVVTGRENVVSYFGKSSFAEIP